MEDNSKHRRGKESSVHCMACTKHMIDNSFINVRKLQQLPWKTGKELRISERIKSLKCETHDKATVNFLTRHSVSLDESKRTLVSDFSSSSWG